MSRADLLSRAPEVIGWAAAGLAVLRAIWWVASRAWKGTRRRWKAWRARPKVWRCCGARMEWDWITPRRQCRKCGATLYERTGEREPGPPDWVPKIKEFKRPRCHGDMVFANPSKDEARLLVSSEGFWHLCEKCGRRKLAVYDESRRHKIREEAGPSAEWRDQHADA